MIAIQLDSSFSGTSVQLKTLGLYCTSVRPIMHDNTHTGGITSAQQDVDAVLVLSSKCIVSSTVGLTVKSIPRSTSNK